MILPLSLLGLFGFAAVALLLSPWPYLAPATVLALAGLLAPVSYTHLTLPTILLV